MATVSIALEKKIEPKKTSAIDDTKKIGKRRNIFVRFTKMQFDRFDVTGAMKIARLYRQIQFFDISITLKDKTPKGVYVHV